MSQFLYKRIYFVFFLCLAVNYNTFCQTTKTVNFCINSFPSLPVTYTLLKSSYIVFSKRQSTTDSCYSFKIASQGTYQVLIESNCCGVISKLFKADTLQINTTFYAELKEKLINLNEVVVRSGSRIQSRGDTLIIKTSDVQTRPHADASVLFDKIPGLEVGMGGGVRILGKTVQEITIDGKKIFGGAPGITLNSIKANMIEQMEFVEKKLANGQVASQLNLKLKSNRKNGDYGDLVIGYGGGNNYYSGGHYSKIGKESFLSSYLTANSLNEKGFDMKDIERIMYNSFRNTLNGTSSIIGLYDNQNQLNSQEIQYLNQTFLGVNKVLNGGGNYTFTGKKSDSDVFVIFNKNKQEVFQKNLKKIFFAENTFLQKEEKTNHSELNKISIGVNNKFQLSKNTTFRIANQLEVNLEKRLLFDTLDSRINESILDYQINSKRNSKWEELKNNFQLSLDRRGTRKGVMSSLYFNVYNKLPNEEINSDNLFINSASVLQQQLLLNKKDKFAKLQLQAVQSMPLSKGFLLEGKISSIREYFTYAQRAFSANSNKESLNMSGDISVQDFKHEIGLYLMRQQPKLTMILGVAYWDWLSKRNKNNDITLYKKSLIRIPLGKIEYRASPRFSTAMYYHNNPVFPEFNHLTSIPDSSNLMNFSVGNLALQPYFEKNLGLSSKFVVGRGFNINFTLDYNRYERYIISEQKFSNDIYFISNSFISSEKPVENIKLNFFILKIGSNSKLTWAMIISFNKLNSYLQINEALTPINTGLFFSTQSLKWNANDKLLLQADWKGSIATTKKSTIFYNTILFKSEYELNKTLYLNTSLNSIINMNTSRENVFQPFLDFEISKYLFKNNSLSVSMILKNAFNLKNQVTITQNINQQNILYSSYLPRVLLLKLTFYPEIWK